MNQELEPPVLLEFSVKPKILYVADVPNWSFDIKIRRYRKHLPQFDIDIGYMISSDESLQWQNIIKTKKYDVIWHQHQQNIPFDNLASFVAYQNNMGTRVVCTINEVLTSSYIKNNIKALSFYNNISVNNPWSYKNFIDSGFQNIFKTYDGVDLHTFGPDVPIQKREFKVFFSSSKIRLEHKGYYVLQEVKKILKDRGEDIQFVEIISDSFNNTRTPSEMNEIYNQCQVFVCLSLSEGGPCTLQEAAACGLVPIMTRVGYSDYFKNSIIIDRDPLICANHISYLKANPDVLVKRSHEISKEILPWDDKYMAKHWGYFLQNISIRSKGIKLL